MRVVVSGCCCNSQTDVRGRVAVTRCSGRRLSLRSAVVGCPRSLSPRVGFRRLSLRSAVAGCPRSLSPRVGCRRLSLRSAVAGFPRSVSPRVGCRRLLLLPCLGKPRRADGQRQYNHVSDVVRVSQSLSGKVRCGQGIATASDYAHFHGSGQK
jgi:hypothetical protein